MSQVLVAIIFVGLVSGLLIGRWRPTWLFGGAMLACYACGLVTTEELLEKSVNQGLVTLLLLLLVSIGLEKMDWLLVLSRRLISKRYSLSVLRLSVVTAVMSAFVNNTAVVAILANGVKNDAQHAASKLLIPLSYAAILGGTTTLIGTSTNLIVNSFLIDAGEPGLAFFDFFKVGGLAAIAGIFTLLLSGRLLPSYETKTIKAAEFFVEAKLQADSSLIGRTVLENGLRNLESLFLVEIIREGHLISPVPPGELLDEGDVLIFSGDVKEIKRLEQFQGLELFASSSGLLDKNLTEVVVMPNATIVGKTIKQVGFRAMFDAAVVGMRRGGERLSGKLGSIVLRPGDSMLLAVGPDFSERKNIDKNFAVLSGVRLKRMLTPVKNVAVGLAFIVVVILAAYEILPLFKGLLFLLAGMLAAGIVSSGELKRRFPYSFWIIICSALVLAQALSNTGLVTQIADALHANLESVNPAIAMIGIFFATLLLTELMTNNAAAALSFPIAFGLAQSFGVSPMPFVMAVAYGASASFLTPYGYNTNLMVQNIAGYQLRDYVRAGLPVSIVYSIIVLYAIPRVFPF
ncbi:MAG: SLC13 family permease [Pseudomonadales bacterium]